MRTIAVVIMLATVVACGQKKTEAALEKQRVEMENEQLRDSIQMVKQMEEQKAEEEAVAQQQQADQKTGDKEVRVVREKTYVTQNAAAGTENATSENSATEESKPEKKGLSNKAKGALIGAGAGALTGAAVSKKQGKGAIIGGAVGAGVGLGTGAILDKRKEKKEQEGE